MAETVRTADTREIQEASEIQRRWFVRGHTGGILLAHYVQPEREAGADRARAGGSARRSHIPWD